MALFTAVKNGPSNDGDTFGNTSPGIAGTDYPDPAGGDSMDLGTYEVDQVGALTLVALTDVGTGGVFNITDDFTCPLVDRVRMELATHHEAVADVPTTAAGGAFTVGSNVAVDYPTDTPFTAAGTVGGTNDGDYVVDSPGATYAGGVTTIPCTVAKRPTNQASETGTLKRWLPIEIVTGVHGDAKGLIAEPTNVLMLYPSSMFNLTGDVVAYGSMGIDFDSGGILVEWNGDCHVLGAATGINFNQFGKIITWTGNLYVGGEDEAPVDNDGIYFLVNGEIETWTGNAANTASGKALRFSNGGHIGTWIGDCSNTGGISRTGLGCYFDSGGEIDTWTFTKCPEGVSYGGTFGTLMLQSAVFPAEANVEIAETAYGPTGAEYAGALDIAAAEAAAAAAQLATDTAEVESKKANVKNTETILGVAGTLDIAADNPPATIIRCGG